MWSRLTIVFITAFWVAMSALLWRAEFGPRKALGAEVPTGLVWQKVLTAPDHSTLEIRHGTNVIGLCNWRPDVGQEFATGLRMENPEQIVEGMVQHLTYYTLDVDGQAMLPWLPQRAQFRFDLTLDTNRVWRSFRLQVTLRPDVYEISANAAEQEVNLRVNAGGENVERVFRFTDLQNPQKLLAELGGLALPLVLGFMGSMPATNTPAQSLGLRWEAHNDSLRLGKNAVRAYRLRATVLDRYEAVFYVSPVGEILRIELPQKIVLANTALSALRPME